MPTNTVFPIRLTKRAKHELIPDRIKEYANKTGRSVNAVALEAFRIYLDNVEGDKVDPVLALAESIQKAFDGTSSMINNVSQAILNDRERITRNSQFMNAIISVLSDEDQRTVVDKAMHLMQSQAASDEQIAQWQEQEAQGIETPLSVAARNLKQAQEDGRKRENPDRN